MRIPRFPTELLNFESIANLLAANSVGVLIKIDSNSLLKNKIRFARACVRVDISEPLLEYAEIIRSGGKVCGYNIWYEDFFTGCSFCGSEEHAIDVCPLLNAPKKAISISLLKSPKQKSLAEILSLATRQEKLVTRAEEANVVQAKPKPVPRVPVKKKFVPYKDSFHGKFSSVPHKKRDVGIVFKENVQMSGKKDATPFYGKGKGKAVLWAAAPGYEEISDSDDDAESMAAPVPLPSDVQFQAAMLETAHCVEGGGDRLADALPPSKALVMSPVPLQVLYPADYLEGNQFGPLAASGEKFFGDFSVFESGVNNGTMIIRDEDVSLGEFHTQPENSFHSIDSESSIVKHIGALLEPTSLSSASKRRKGNGEEDSASSALKRSRV